jgi:glycosyltransferase involved in cell wall biosynthesis
VTDPITILHFTAPPIVGGVEITIFNHASLLSHMGYSVEVIAGRGEPFLPKVVFHKIQEIDSRYKPVVQLGKILAKGEVPDEFFDLRNKIAARLRPILAQAQTCIVHNAMTLHKNLALTAALHMLAGEKVTRMIAWCHDFAWQDNLYSSDLHNGYPWNLLRTPWAGVQYIVVSEHRRQMLSALLQLPEDEFLVITPGIDLHNFLRLAPLTSQIIDNLKLLRSDPLLLLPARITRRKNIELAIKVIAALKKTRPQVNLIITGPPGPHNPNNIAYLEKLLKLRQELNVIDNVQFLYQQGEGGQSLHIPNEVVADLYRLSDALLFPSLREGFGIPILEAGLSRLPVFAARIPPVQESANESGYLFDPGGEPRQIAQMIDNFFEEDLAYRLRHRVLDHYIWESIVTNQLIPLIQPPSKP